MKYAPKHVWSFVIATDDYSCPHCGAERGKVCTSPSGVKLKKPHAKRVKQLTSNDWERCKGTVNTMKGV